MELYVILTCGHFDCYPDAEVSEVFLKKSSAIEALKEIKQDALEYDFVDFDDVEVKDFENGFLICSDRGSCWVESKIINVSNKIK